MGVHVIKAPDKAEAKAMPAAPLFQPTIFKKHLFCCVRYGYDLKHIMTIIIFGTQLWTNSFNLEHPGFSLLLNFSHLETESSNSWTDNWINKPCTVLLYSFNQFTRGTR